MNKYTIETYILMTVIVSFLGFCLENIWLIVRKGYIDNRNMYLPFLAGYGITIIAIWFVFGVPYGSSEMICSSYLFGNSKGYLNYYICMFISVSIGEIALGITVEKLCGFYYWDYTSIPLHITRYTSLPTSAAFAFIITGFMDRVYIPLMDFLSHVQDKTENAGIILFIFMCADTAISLRKMYISRALNKYWHVQVINKANKELIEIAV